MAYFGVRMLRRSGSQIFFEKGSLVTRVPREAHVAVMRGVKKENFEQFSDEVCALENPDFANQTSKFRL